MQKRRMRQKIRIVPTKKKVGLELVCVYESTKNQQK